MRPRAPSADWRDCSHRSENCLVIADKAYGDPNLQATMRNDYEKSIVKCG